MLEPGYVTRAEWKAHIQTHPFVAHDIWPRIKDYVPAHGYSRAEIDAMFEGYSGGGMAQIDASNVIGLTQGSIPFAAADGSLTEDNANLFWLAGSAHLGVHETTPTALVHIYSIGGAIPCLNLEGGAEGEIVTPDGQSLRLGHWNSGTVTFTERMKFDAAGSIFIPYFTTGHVLFSAANGELIQDANQFYYNVGAHSLGVGAQPTNPLYISGLGTTAGWGGAYGGIVARFYCTNTKHTGVVIDAQGTYDAVLGFSKGSLVKWAIRNDHSETDEFQIRCHSGVLNRIDFSIDLSGNIEIHTGYFGILSQHELRFYEGANYVGFEAPALGGDQIWVLPNADGPANEALATDGGGNLIWRTHDELAGYEANEHVALPNTIANVLTDHDKAAHDALGLSHDSLADVSIDDHHARDHTAEHGPGGDDALKLDDLAAPDDNVDLDFSTAKHGLVPKGTDVGNFLKDDGTWAVCAGGDDEKVAVDDAAVAGYLGAASNDGVLRVDAPLTYADGGNFVTLGLDIYSIQHHDLGGLGDDDHTQYILHSLAAAANDFLVASGANTFVKKTLAETGAILEGDINHDNLVGYEADEHVALPNTIANVLSDHNVAAHDALGLSHDDLVDVSIDDHHARDHEAEHEVGGDDLVNHDSLTGFVAAEHLLVGAINHDALLNFVAGEHLLVGAIDHNSLLNYAANRHIVLPGTIANVLSDHNQAAHDAYIQYRGFKSTSTGAGNDWDNYTSPGMAHSLSLGSDSNGPDGSGDYFHPMVLEYQTTGNILQLAIPYIASNGSIFMRSRYSSSWSSWYEFWHSGNDGAGSGLAADLLDGQHGAYYAVSGGAEHDGFSDFVAAEHLLVGAIDHNSLLNYAANRHIVLPNTIANVLSDHNKAGHDALGLSHDSLADVSVDDHHAQVHNMASHSDDNTYNILTTGTLGSGKAQITKTAVAAGSNDYHLELYSPDTTDSAKEVSIRFHQGGRYYYQIRARSGGFRFTAGATDVLDNIKAAKVYVGETFYLSALMAHDKVSDSDKLDGSHLSALILHSLADAANDFLVASGANTFIKKTLAQTGAILEGDMHHDNLQGFVANEHIDHSAVSITAGSGLSGGGTIAASRTLNLGALTGNWDAGAFEIRAKTFESDQATGTAPFTIASTTKVTNLNADLLDNYHASSAAGNNTIVLRTAAGYIYCNYLNCTSGATVDNPTHYFVEIDNDSFLRQMTPANFVSRLSGDGVLLKSGGICTGLIQAKDHGAAAIPEIVNVVYGTGSPPAAAGTPIGTIWVKYTA